MAALKGTSVSPGIAIGRALVIGRWDQAVPHYQIAPDQVREELRRFWLARRQCREEIRALREQTAKSVGGKYAAIFDAHLMILDDRKLGRDVMRRVQDQLMNAEWALASSIGKLVATMQQVEDPVLRERGMDIKDVYDRLLRVLGGQENRHVEDLELSEDTIVVAHALSPSDAIWLHQPRIVGFVTETGGPTSHTAILANALEIPAVLGVDNATGAIADAESVVVDGIHGNVILRPTPGVVEAYRREQQAWLQFEKTEEVAAGPVSTADGVALRVLANIEFPEEMATVKRVGAHGIGLYRSEFLFLSVAPNLPSEEDHYQAYRKIAESASPDPVVIRTLDLGGEKYFHKVLEAGEANPVLGMRAVRFCLARPDIFRVQLRGLLRVAAECGNVSILVPMVSGLEEWRQVVRFAAQVKDELRAEGLAMPDKVPLGAMIEIPSAALVADHLAREADFFSIGTNDLIQYTLAVDRGNRRVSYLYDPWHPAVLRLLEQTIRAGREAGIPVTLCGEMASDPLGALTLLGLGLTAFSCNPLTLPEVRAILRIASARDAREALDAALSLSDGAKIKLALADRLRDVLLARSAVPARRTPTPPESPATD